MLDRREFVQRSTLAAAFFGLPRARAEEAFGQPAPPLPARELYSTDPDRYWAGLPRPPASTDEIMERFLKALTPRTRLMLFSHITSTTGLILPVKEICQVARQRGILTHVDGAHAIGQIPLDLHDLGCDFYTSSPHKWLLAPKGTGTLYVRSEMLARLWVNIASRDWRDYSLKAYRFSNFGTSNLSVM